MYLFTKKTMYLWKKNVPSFGVILRPSQIDFMGRIIAGTPAVNYIEIIFL